MKAAEQETLDAARENQARVLAGLGSPKVLVGGINHGDCPNFHTLHMIGMGASIVSITSEIAHVLRPDRLFVHPEESITDVLRRLPARWRPDFFWDAQAEQGHYFPVGLGELDVPTVVSFNHAHLGQALLHMEGMFDCLIRPSAFMWRWGDAYLPFGGSWGTMEERIRMYGGPSAAERDVTVSCTIGTSGLGRESVRWEILRELQAIKARRPDWNVVLGQRLDQDAYFDLLARSRAAINVGTWGAAMTYRPLEVIAQEAVLVHADETAYGSESSLREFFPPEWYVDTKPDGLEQAIERALLVSPEDKVIVRKAMNEAYSYRSQYGKVFDLAASVKKRKKLSPVDWSRRACAINELTGYPEHADVHRWALTDSDIASMSEYPDKDWDVCFWQPDDNEERVKWRTDLALRTENPKDVYRKYATTRAAAQRVPGT